MDLKMFVQLFALAFVVESLVEYLVGKLFDELPKVSVFDGAKWKWLQAYFAAAFGLAITVFYHVDIFPQLGLSGSVVGQVLTGLLISRGSNFVNDIFTKFTQKPPG